MQKYEERFGICDCVSDQENSSQKQMTRRSTQVTTGVSVYY